MSGVKGQDNDKEQRNGNRKKKSIGAHGEPVLSLVLFWFVRASSAIGQIFLGGWQGLHYKDHEEMGRASAIRVRQTFLLGRQGLLVPCYKYQEEPEATSRLGAENSNIRRESMYRTWYVCATRETRANEWSESLGERA